MIRRSAAGQEVLVVDKDDKVARGMQTLLGASGPGGDGDRRIRCGPATCWSPSSSRWRCWTSIRRAPGAGSSLLKFARDKSPLTTVIVMTARKAFDVGVAGFRGGAADVVVKEPDTVPYLKDRVLAAAAESGGAIRSQHAARGGRRRARGVSPADARAVSPGAGHGGPRSGTRGRRHRSPRRRLLGLVGQRRSRRRSCRSPACCPRTRAGGLTVAQTGGEGLDLANQLRPQIVLVKDPLPDLPARMVVNTREDQLARTAWPSCTSRPRGPAPPAR